MLEELMTAEATLASRKRGVSGLLRINLPISFGRLCVMPVLMDVAVKNPNLQLDISFADRGVDLVEEGTDLFVRLGDPGNQASLVGRRIGTQHSLICASSDYLDRRGRPASVEEQKEHDCLAFSMLDRGQRWCVDILGHSAAPYDHP